MWSAGSPRACRHQMGELTTSALERVCGQVSSVGVRLGSVQIDLGGSGRNFGLFPLRHSLREGLVSAELAHKVDKMKPFVLLYKASVKQQTTRGFLTNLCDSPLVEVRNGCTPLGRSFLKLSCPSHVGALLIQTISGRLTCCTAGSLLHSLAM